MKWISSRWQSELTDAIYMKIRPYNNTDEDSVVRLWKECGLVTPQNNPIKDIHPCSWFSICRKKYQKLETTDRFRVCHRKLPGRNRRSDYEIKSKTFDTWLESFVALRRHSETAIETNRFAIHHRILDQELREVRVFVRVSKTLWENH